MELVLIGLVVLLIFGAGRISEVGKGLGEGIWSFKKGLKDDQDAPQVPERSDDTRRDQSSARRPKDDEVSKRNETGAMPED